MNRPSETLTEDAIRYIRKLFSGNADGHDADHSLRVYKNAMRIAAGYPEADEELIVLASLLHDADDHKLFQTEDYSNARLFLKEKNISEEKTCEIARIIGSVSFSKNRGKTPDTLEGKIVQDADRLDAMGAIGIARTFAYGGKHGRSIEDSVQHFHDKLLLLEGTLNTEEARAMAKERHEFLVKFLDELGKEI